MQEENVNDFMKIIGLATTRTKWIWHNISNIPSCRGDLRASNV